LPVRRPLPFFDPSISVRYLFFHGVQKETRWREITKAYDGNGTIYIPCEDSWFSSRSRLGHLQGRLRVPFNLDDIRFRDGEIQIDYAFSTPRSIRWTGESSGVASEMQEKKKTG
jgi:hypothetical protein